MEFASSKGVAMVVQPENLCQPLQTLREKVAAIIVDVKFFTTLSDGSQAKKARLDMELILTRTERNGIPVYFVTSLATMSEFGGKYLCDLYNLT